MSKYLSLFLCLMFFAVSTFAKTWGELPAITWDTTPEPPAEEIFKIVEVMPFFAGCEEIEDKDERKICSDKNIITFINSNIRYPEGARKQGIEGTAVVRFVIGEDGKITTDKNSVLRDPGAGIGKEALRIVNIMPDWIPGKNEGKPVKVQFTLPIRFILEEDETVPEFRPVMIKWSGIGMKGTRKTTDKSLYTKAECTLEQATEILNEKKRGLPIMLDYGKESGGFTQYYMAVGKTMKKELITSEFYHKSAKKKMLKEIQSGSTIYFYNWEFKKGFLEIKVK